MDEFSTLVGFPALTSRVGFHRWEIITKPNCIKEPKWLYVEDLGNKSSFDREIQFIASQFISIPTPPKYASFSVAPLSLHCLDPRSLNLIDPISLVTESLCVSWFSLNCSIALRLLVLYVDFTTKQSFKLIILHMKSAKLIKSTLSYKSTSKTTINQSIVDALLLKCRNLKQFDQILSQMIFTGFIKDTYAASRILNFCTGQSPFINVHYSRKIFDHVENSNAFIYNTMMRAYLQTNHPKETFVLYALMLKNKNKVYPDSYTYPIVIQACIARYSVLEGKEIHDHVVKMGFDSDVYARNTLINMYAVCDDMMDARKVFDESPIIDLVSWNSLLAGYVHMGNVEEAKLIFDQMPEKNIIASNSMIVLFGRCGLIAEAYQLFVDMNEKDLVSWTALISCYEQTGMYQEALALFIEMYERGIKIDEVVVISVLSACAHSSVVKTGSSIHGLVLTRGTESYVNIQNALIHMYSICGDIEAAEKLFNSSSHIDIISWNSMISGYLKCGLLKKAREVFDSMPEKDVVSWSALISGHAQLGLFDDTVALFQEMMLHGNVEPDETILIFNPKSDPAVVQFSTGFYPKKASTLYMFPNYFNRYVFLFFENFDASIM
ncbi:hypothetical protein L6452_15586 [Arctium lappa]|uniref:Uncharacterized protein n=1 Tax=Arctium lappa TaxID=4217 RepID=A0ACB9CP38_ARCLA|nr:hypothetical protein L6452_15586 [Arctium lappa]